MRTEGEGKKEPRRFRVTTYKDRRRHDNLPEDATRKGAHRQQVRDQRMRVKGGKSYVDAEYLW